MSTAYPTEPSQQEFSLDFEAGTFDPATLGVCLTVETSIPPILRSTLATALFRKQTPFSRQQLFREAYQKQLDDQTSFTLLSYSAVLEHELRHFHEFLVTPYGQWMIYMLIELYAFTTLFTPELKHEKCIVVPLTAWASLSDQDHERIQSFANYSTLRRVPPPITNDLLPACARLANELDALSKPRPLPNELKSFGFTIKQLMEGSAINVQLSVLADTFRDEKTVESFFETLRLKDKLETYTHALNWWYTLELRIDDRRAGRLINPRIGYGLRNALVFYALCATRRGTKDVPASIEEAVTPDNLVHPGDIFAALASKMWIAKKVPPFRKIVDWCDEASEELGLLTLKESLQSAVKLSRLRAEFLRKAYSGLLGIGLLDAYDRWVEAQEYMSGMILEDPWAFFEPKTYLSHLPKWVAAPAFLLTNFQAEEGQHFGDVLASKEAKQNSSWKIFFLEEPRIGMPIIDVPSLRLLSLASLAGMALFRVRKAQPAYNHLLRFVRQSINSEWDVWEM